MYRYKFNDVAFAGAATGWCFVGARALVVAKSSEENANAKSKRTSFCVIRFTLVVSSFLFFRWASASRSFRSFVICSFLSMVVSLIREKKRRYDCVGILYACERLKCVYVKAPAPPSQMDICVDTFVGRRRCRVRCFLFGRTTRIHAFREPPVTKMYFWSSVFARHTRDKIQEISWVQYER